jgi:acyl-CoA dehydrogenase
VNDELKLLADTSAALFTEYQQERTSEFTAPWDERLWRALEDTGFTLISVPELAGGTGGSLDQAAVVLAAAGEHAANVPLGETALLGGWLLAEAGLPVPPGPLIAVRAPDTVRLARTPGGWSVSGRLPRVGWGRVARRVGMLVVADGREVVVSLHAADVTVTPGRNLAGEPRDDLVLDAAVGSGDVMPVPDGTGETLRRRAALVRVVLLAGAMERALGLTVRYAGERQQFGRPVGNFQAIQLQVAELAAEVAATRSGVDAAVRRCADDGFADPRSWFALAAAKVQAARGAGVAARIAHQVHGAIGFTDEHPLRLATTRLWAWRDEAGSQAQWAADLGGHVLAGAGDSLWNILTETEGTS